MRDFWHFIAHTHTQTHTHTHTHTHMWYASASLIFGSIQFHSRAELISEDWSVKGNEWDKSVERQKPVTWQSKSGGFSQSRVVVFGYPGVFWSIKTQELACCVVFLLQWIYNWRTGFTITQYVNRQWYYLTLAMRGGRGVCLTVIEHCAQLTIVKSIVCTVLFRGRRNGQRYEQWVNPGVWSYKPWGLCKSGGLIRGVG